MSIEVSTVKRLRLYEEPNGSYGVDGTGTLSNFIDVPAIEGTVQLTRSRPTNAATPLQQFIDGYAEEHLMPRTWSLSFEIPIATFDTAADDGVAATQGALGRILKIGLNGEDLGTGDTVSDASPAATDFDVATVARWSVGKALGVAAGGPSGGFGAREIEDISGSTITFKQSFTAAPADSEDIYNCATYYMGAGGGGAATSAQFLYEGIESDDRWYLAGGQLTSISPSIGPGSVPRISVTFEGTRWYYADGSNQSADLTASALAAASYSDDLINVVQDSVFAVGTVGTATSPDSIALPASEISVSLNVSWAKVMTPGGVETVSQFVRRHVANEPSVTGSFTVPYEDDTWFTARDTRTDHYVFYQIGSTATNRCVLISIPTVQITDVQLTDQDGLQYQQVSWKARHDADTVESTSSYLGRSVFRIHLF